MKKTPNREISPWAFVSYGARSITLTPSVKGVSRRIPRAGIASDWKKVGKDIRASMNKVARELA